MAKIKNSDFTLITRPTDAGDPKIKRQEKLTTQNRENKVNITHINSPIMKKVCIQLKVIPIGIWN